MAAELFRRVTEILPAEADGWYGLATALLQSRRPAEALIALRGAYELAPDDPSHAPNLGILLVDHAGSVAEGLTCLRHADRLGHQGRLRAASGSPEWRSIAAFQSPNYRAEAASRLRFSYDRAVCVTPLRCNGLKRFNFDAGTC